jgi:hypothetical protein
MLDRRYAEMVEHPEIGIPRDEFIAPMRTRWR